AIVFQNRPLLHNITLLDNMRVLLKYFTTQNESDRTEMSLQKLDEFGVAEYAYHYPDELDQSVTIRAAIAAACALEPDILYLDEPTTGLDPLTTTQLNTQLSQLTHDTQMTLVITTNDLGCLYQIADRCLILDDKTHTPLAYGNPHEIAKTTDDDRLKDFLTHHGALQWNSPQQGRQHEIKN
ncbi:unnamed protein product, partial [marine sediment metagenome]